MSSNIRAKSIEGHVTDSAGNILRNSQIIIKQATPSGSYTVDTVYSDDSGYFISKPIPNGTYDIYESGIRVSRIIHKADENSIQCFKAHSDNYDILNLENFELLVDSSELNKFKAFIQIEPSETDISQYGNSFPIYDFTFPSSDPQLGNTGNQLWDLSKFFEFGTDSRITTTRFDIEYFLPLTSLSSTYQRIRWAGVPAIKFFEDSKLLVPLDYFSIVLNYPKVISPSVINFGESDITIEESTTTTVILTNTNEDDNFDSLSRNVRIGDILKLTVNNGGDDESYYGIIVDINLDLTITLEKLLSTNYSSTDVSGGSYYVKRIYAYSGMFSGITEINEEVNERFSVVENVYAQNLSSEIYAYTNRYTG